MTARHCYLHNLVFKQVLEAVRIGFYLARNARADLCCRAMLTMKSRSILNVGQASRLPGRRSRLQNDLRARAGAPAGQAGRLPYVAGTRSQ